MTFEEQFPSLKGNSPYPLMRKAMNTKTLSVATQDMIARNSETIEIPYRELKVFDEEVIQAHCLDKQKLKDIIIKIQKCNSSVAFHECNRHSDDCELIIDVDEFKE